MSYSLKSLLWLVTLCGALAGVAVQIITHFDLMLNVVGWNGLRASVQTQAYGIGANGMLLVVCLVLAVVSAVKTAR